MTERQADTRRTKDYDTIVGDQPHIWAERFDVSNWGFIVARAAGERVGGAVIAFDCAGLHMLEGRRDLAVLWDLRVSPTVRGCGVGAALFTFVEKWCLDRKCKQLKIETQNTNLEACKFYAKQGCMLGAINRFAYPNISEEIQLLWYKTLIAASHAD